MTGTPNTAHPHANLTHLLMVVRSRLSLSSKRIPPSNAPALPSRGEQVLAQCMCLTATPF